MTDYYELDKGCCLRCNNAHEGCLCSLCNCKKCDWYMKELVENKPCKKVEELLAQRKKDYIAKMEALQGNQNDKFNKKIKTLKAIEQKQIEAGEMIEYFVCQKCFVEFTLSHSDYGDCNFLCIPNLSPLCPICLEENAQKSSK